MAVSLKRDKESKKAGGRKTALPKLGSIVTAVVVKPHDGLQAGTERRVVVSPAIQECFRLKLWKEKK